MQERFSYLLNQYYQRQASPEELEEFYTLVDSGQYDDALRDFMDNAYNLETTTPQTEAHYPPGAEHRILRNVFKIENGQSAAEEQIQTLKVRRLWPRIAAAASILLFLSIGGYWLIHQTAPVQLASNDVSPFTKQAILKTGHGKTLQLDSTHKGLLAQYVNTNIHSANNAVTYTNNNTTETTTVFDTLQVPAGGKPYHLKLADGSAITVNVASAVRFPENFRNGNNEVELISGEAYFSIIHNKNAMLTIKAKDQTIQDYGTEFDVNAYNDEPDGRTTLVEGSVKVNNRLLIPGQQAIVAGGGLTVAKANIGQVTAWVKGYFRFNGEDIQTVMRELARAYNIEVKYEGKISKEGYYLKIARSMKISEVLRVLERTNSVHFKIEGRRITVYGKK